MRWLAVALIVFSARSAHASAWQSLGAGIQGTSVTRLHVWNGNLVAAGDFSIAGIDSAHNIAVWDGVQWSALGDGWDSITGIATYNSDLAVAGVRPGNTDGEIATWDGTAWTTVVISNLYHLAVYNGRFWQAGHTDLGNGSGRSGVVEYDGTSWQATGGTWDNLYGITRVKVLTVLDGELFVHVSPWGLVESWDGTTWTSYGGVGADEGYAMAKEDSAVWVSESYGGFSIVTKRLTTAIGWLYDGFDAPCNQMASGPALTAYDGRAVIGGAFPAGCLPAPSVVSWNSVVGQWEAVPGEMNARIYALTTYNNSLIAAGVFTTVDGTPMSRIARFSGVLVPVAISRFDARAEADGVVLSWEVAADELFSGFDVYRSENKGPEEKVNRALLSADARTFTDKTITPGSRYTYFIVARGTSTGDVRSPRVDVEVAPPDVALYQNVPNPFNPETTIRFAVAERDRVTISVYDTNGRWVRTLVDHNYNAGEWSTTWNGTDDGGSRVASGVYFYRMRIGKVERSRKMILLK